MKKLFSLALIFLTVYLPAQQGMYRHLPQAQVNYFFSCEIGDPVKTADKGYIFNFFPWTMNLHGLAPTAYYIIKTDSNFVPQWKKPYNGTAVALPTGGIILIYHTYQSFPNSNYSGMHIEKVTASGVQVWIKSYSTDYAISLNGGVSYSNKVRFVGKNVGNSGFPSFAPTSQAYTCELDTMGNLISQSLFSNSYAGNADFSRIKRDAQGNFYVYSLYDPLSISAFSLAKFDPNFSFLWGRRWSLTNQPLHVNDIDILPGGRIFATGLIQGNYPAPVPIMGALLKFDSQGGLLGQCYFDRNLRMSGLCKKANGNYIISSARVFNDSLFMFEADTSLNVIWNKFSGFGTSVGTSVINTNTVFTPFFYGSDPVISSCDLNGNSCRSYALPYTKLTSTLNPPSCVFTPVTCTATINNGTINVISSQTYQDSCKCPVSIPVMQNLLCVGNTGTINITGTGNVSWYASATGNSFIKSGPQFVYSSNTPTSLTIYAQDSACTLNPIRTPVTINVMAVPVLSFSPPNPTICTGNQVFVTALGASTFSWSHNLPISNVQNLNPVVATVYTVTGTSAPGCSDTKTVGIFPISPPTLTVSSPSTICAGATASVWVNGTATTYTWNNNGGGNPSFTLSPAAAGQTVFTVIGSIGSCSSSKQTTLSVLALPSLSVSSSATNICSGTSATLMASGAATYVWSAAGLLVSFAAIVVTPPSSWTYSLTGKSLDGCISKTTMTVSVVPTPTLVTSPLSYFVCEGVPVTFSATGASTYSWNTGLSTNSLSIPAPPGTSSYTLTGTNAICSKTVGFSVTAYPTPTITFQSAPALICSGNTATITASGAASFNWSNSSQSNSIVVTATPNITYSVQGANGTCVNSDTISLQVLATPSMTLLVNKQTVCQGDDVILNVSGASSYSWNMGSTANSLTLSPQTSTSYVVTGTDLSGCSAIKTTSITVHSLPTILLSSNDPTICTGESATLSATGANSYTWAGPSFGPQITVSPTLTTIYVIQGTGNNGCSTTATVTQYVQLCTGLKDLNGDGTFISVMPNPNSGRFSLYLEPVKEGSYLELYNPVGQLILKEPIRNPVSSLDLNDAAVGVYYLRVYYQEKPVTFKVIRQ